jgi:uncharacterized Zn finger protein
MGYGYGGWPRYVPVAERRAKAARQMNKMGKSGRRFDPVVIEGRAIATTFWGKAWCDNLETYRDFDNRLPRGRTYARNGSVMDLQIAPLRITALVSGSDLYNVDITVEATPKAQWKAICRDCAGGIDSLVELLQGRFSKAVMERLCRQRGGLFPEPSRITFSCDCPDHADMCKHVAAVLYGVGARLDQKPELLFQLRAVDERDLLVNLNPAATLAAKPAAPARSLASDDLSALFGLEMAPDTAPLAPQPTRARKAAKAAPAPAAEEAVAASSPRAAARASTGRSRAPKPPLQLTKDGFVKWWT